MWYDDTVREIAMSEHLDAVAFAYERTGMKKLVPVIGLGCRSKIEWQDENGTPSKPPEAIADAWASVQRWIEGHKEG